ncbi:uncharacterized protein [Nicotiana tomentosiformis]|uniref:uncharacterized protein n=1 Tax=Nicotiana tomentosiformis TaxID=4098 RepID=UPI00388C5FC9
MPTGKLAKWQILLSEFDIIYVTHKVVKGKALADHLAENPVDREYEPLKRYCPDEEVSFVGEDIVETYDGWRMFFDGASNFKGVGIKVVLVSETGQHYSVSAKLWFPCTNNMAEYKACILGLRLVVGMNIQDLLIEFKHIPRVQNEFFDVLATLPSMIQHPNKNFIDPISIEIRKQPTYCAHVEEDFDGFPWFHDIKEYLEKGDYPKNATHTQKRTLRRLANHFFQRGEILYIGTPNLGLLRCVDSKEASTLLEEIHVKTYGPHMNGFVLAKKILRPEYFRMTMETDCIKCGMDVIGPIEPAASNGHRLILVAIDFFTKWVEAASYKAVTKKVIVDFVCQFGVPESIITDNDANLNSDLMKAMCETFKIKHRNSTAYKPQIKGVGEAANKNIKKILRKMVDKYKQ